MARWESAECNPEQERDYFLADSSQDLAIRWPTMFPKIIKSDAEHETALAHVETLMDAAPGSKAGGAEGVRL